MDNQTDDASPELLKAGRWLCFTRDIDSDQAARRFVERFGRQPDYLIDDKGYLWAGPVPERTTQ